MKKNPLVYIDDIMYRLYFTDKVRKGRVDIHRDGGQYLLKIRI